MTEGRSTFTGLCIGGPRDGKWVTRPHPSFKVMIMESISIDCSLQIETEVVPKIEVIYRQERIHTPDKTFYFWRPDGTSITQCVEKLLAGYKKP